MFLMKCSRSTDGLKEWWPLRALKYSQPMRRISSWNSNCFGEWFLQKLWKETFCCKKYLAPFEIMRFLGRHFLFFLLFFSTNILIPGTMLHSGSVSMKGVQFLFFREFQSIQWDEQQLRRKSSAEYHMAVSRFLTYYYKMMTKHLFERFYQRCIIQYKF